MPVNIILNLTTEVLPQINSTCWNWCVEQAKIHQSNIDITNLGVIGVAMLMLLLYNLSVEFQDEIVNYTELDRNSLIFYGHIIVYFTFILLASFLGYYAFFN